MNPDRELLELAAKAAGLTTNHEWNAERLLLDPPELSLVVFRDGELASTGWNSLENDNDAATLEATLFLDVSWFKNSVRVNAMASWMKWGISINEEFPVFSSLTKKKKAKRRAITLAAAEIIKYRVVKE
jgi:hypothetical protein